MSDMTPKHTLRGVRLQVAFYIKKARLNAGLSQRELADNLNVPRPAISEIEAGRRRVSVEELVVIANQLNIPILDLIEGF